MTIKQYKACRLAIIILLSLSISVSISLENYYLPIIFMLSSLGAMYYCRRQLTSKMVVADERDYSVAGRAARYTILTYGWLGAIGTFVLMALSSYNSVFYQLSQYLAFSVCFIMLLNAFLFRYFIKRQKEDEK